MQALEQIDERIHKEANDHKEKFLATVAFIKSTHSSKIRPSKAILLSDLLATDNEALYCLPPEKYPRKLKGENICSCTAERISFNLSPRFVFSSPAKSTRPHQKLYPSL